MNPLPKLPTLKWLFFCQSPLTNLWIIHSHLWLSNHWLKTISPKGALLHRFLESKNKVWEFTELFLKHYPPFYHRKGNPNLPQRNTQHFFHSSCVPVPLIPLFQHSLWKNKERRRMRRIFLNTGRSDDFREVPGLDVRAPHDLWRCSRCPVPICSLRNVGATTLCCFHFIPSSFHPNNPLHLKLFISSWPYHPTHRCNNTSHTHGIILKTSRNKHHPSQGNWDEEKVSMFSGSGFISSVWFHGSVDILTPPFLQLHGKFQPPYWNKV